MCACFTYYMALCQNIYIYAYGQRRPKQYKFPQIVSVSAVESQYTILFSTANYAESFVSSKTIEAQVVRPILVL